jgi:hypothetical protein
MVPAARVLIPTATAAVVITAATATIASAVMIPSGKKTPGQADGNKKQGKRGGKRFFHPLHMGRPTPATIKPGVKPR